MASEIQFTGNTGKTYYFQVLNSLGLIWSVSLAAFEAYVTANIANYKIAATEVGAASGIYEGSFPSTIVAGTYSIIARNQPGGSPAETDPATSQGKIDWDGAAPLPLSNMATSGQLGQYFPTRLARGVQIKNYPLYFKSSADHVTAFTSGVVSGQIARDGGSFGALQSGAFTEIGLGWYDLQALTSGDLLANSAKLLFTCNGISGGSADPVPIGLVLQKTSGAP